MGTHLKMFGLYNIGTASGRFVSFDKATLSEYRYGLTRIPHNKQWFLHTQVTEILSNTLATLVIIYPNLRIELLGKVHPEGEEFHPPHPQSVQMVCFVALGGNDHVIH